VCLHLTSMAGVGARDNTGAMNTDAATVGLEIRPYSSADAAGTLAVFLAAITQVASADYSREQIAAWARPRSRTVPEWDREMQARGSFVAVLTGVVVGFSDVSRAGYIGAMFVSPSYGRRGVGSSLLTTAECRARKWGARRLSADVSITARPFFERHGFVEIAERHPLIAGVRMTNFYMTKPLSTAR